MTRGQGRIIGGVLAGALLAACAGDRAADGSASDWTSPAARAGTAIEAEAAARRWAEEQPSWVAPAIAHRIVGNVHSVGPRGLGVYLLTGSEGHVLIDGGMAGFEQQIVDAVEWLGFRIEDVALLLNSHAHFDHSGGLAVLKARSGAALWSSAGDRRALETGRYAGSEDDASLTAPPVAVDRVFDDGEVLRVGDIALTVHLTPGHSPGCTSYETTVEADGKPLSVLFFCSATVAGNRLVDPPQYPGIVADYRRSFERLATLRPDVPLANHPGFLRQGPKAKAALAGDAGAYVDPDAFPRLVERLRLAFEAQLHSATSGGRPPALSDSR